MIGVYGLKSVQSPKLGTYWEEWNKMNAENQLLIFLREDALKMAEMRLNSGLKYNKDLDLMLKNPNDIIINSYSAGICGYNYGYVVVDKLRGAIRRRTP